MTLVGPGVRLENCSARSWVEELTVELLGPGRSSRRRWVYLSGAADTGNRGGLAGRDVSRAARTTDALSKLGCPCHEGRAKARG